MHLDTGITDYLQCCRNLPLVGKEHDPRTESGAELRKLARSVPSLASLLTPPLRGFQGDFRGGFQAQREERGRPPLVPASTLRVRKGRG